MDTLRVGRIVAELEDVKDRTGVAEAVLEMAGLVVNLAEEVELGVGRAETVVVRLAA